MPRWSPPPDAPRAPRAREPATLSRGGTWLLVRLLGGVLVGLALLSAARHMGVPGAEELHSHSGVWDGAALLVGYAVTAAAARLVTKHHAGRLHAGRRPWSGD